MSAQEKPVFDVASLILGAFLGLALGSIIAALMSDNMHDTMVKHHSGYYDPNTRDFVYRDFPQYVLSVP